MHVEFNKFWLWYYHIGDYTWVARIITVSQCRFLAKVPCRHVDFYLIPSKGYSAVSVWFLKVPCRRVEFYPCIVTYLLDPTTAYATDMRKLL